VTELLAPAPRSALNQKEYLALLGALGLLTGLALASAGERQAEFRSLRSRPAPLSQSGGTATRPMTALRILSPSATIKLKAVRATTPAALEDRQ
jgi:hypothetical protein